MKSIRLNEITPLIRGVFRSYPLMFTIISMIIATVFKLNSLLFLIILILVSSLFNKFVSKNVLFNLFEALNLKHIAARPEGCKNSSNFINEFSPNKLSTTYGMPSGHSVESMLISVFLVMYILKNHEKSMKRNILIILVLVIGMSVCISRVVLGCHTVLQIIIGGIIGSVIGLYGFKLWDTKIKGQ